MAGPVKLPAYPEIKAFFPDFRAPVVRNFLLLVYCVLSAESLSLYKCAKYVPGKALFDSKYRRLLRFIRMKHASSFCLCVSKLLLRMAPEGSLLVIDRTNWKRGGKPINLLCLGLVVYDRFYLPLLCESLAKDGASSAVERIRLLKQFVALKGSGKGYTLLADREFVGKIWLRWLRTQGIEVVLRLREGDYFSQACSYSDELVSLEGFRRQVHRKGHVTIHFQLEGYWFYYTGLIDKKIGGDVFYLLSSRACALESVRLYAKRWTIETFFKQLKSAGFQLESTGLTEPKRLGMLMAVASLAYLSTLEEGMREAKKRPIKMKWSPGQWRRWPEVSVFRYGLRTLTAKIRTLGQFRRWMKRLFQRKKRRWGIVSLYESRQSVQY